MTENSIGKLEGTIGSMRLREKVALVTGSAKGIGKAIGIALAREGCDVIVSDIDVEPLDGVVQEIKKIGRRSIAIVADVCDQKQVNNMVDKCVERFGKIDILVNNAGGSMGTPMELPPKVIGDVTEHHWDLVIDTNLKGTFFCTQAALKHMRKQKSGKIVNISSLAGRIGHLETSPHYSAAKAGVLGLTRHVAKEVGPYGINVNTICPGFIISGPRIERLWQERQETGKADKMMNEIALGRLGRVEEVAGVVVFLCSNEASYITGATIDVNGGYAAI
jgi:3-oxoacyl-[acyl-carrier protein] reductase